MIDLLSSPRCRPEDLGKPIPDSPHAVSVCLPLWEHNIGYEQADPNVTEKMQSGYPRFFVHPLVAKLFTECEARFAAVSRAAGLSRSEVVGLICGRYKNRNCPTGNTDYNWRTNDHG